MRLHMSAILLGVLTACIILASAVSVIVLQNPLRQSQDQREQASTGNHSIAADGCVITGCSGQICTDQAGAARGGATICMYTPQAACYQASGICRVQSNGQCGWTQTPELLSCLAQIQTSPSPSPSLLPSSTPSLLPSDLPFSSPSPTPSPIGSPLPCTPRPPCADGLMGDNGGTVTCSPPVGEKWCAAADFNHDGKVDLLDYSLFMQQFMK